MRSAAHPRPRLRRDGLRSAVRANIDILLGAPLNEPDRATFYGGDHRGYTDYPALGAVAK
ncbi:hypothetical protein CF165_12975 [Amycolatopsis vastitatis]|uniref:NADH:flavin oxidoreductase/NADH oxidase N-terminal domain-containing protein n=1 Tax=Amycolatopsis vastitatis TaxID=1905142 RepID=A0A229TBV7_9PSEU|nr:hypothetical protein CF165_12975 [Amycolatopsis vastitatis]